MRRKDKEIFDIKEIEEIINRAQICRLALTENDIPYIVPMNYGYKDKCLYFHSANEGKKIDMIRKNPKVCFEMDIDEELVNKENPCKWGMKFLSVIGFGTAEIINDFESKKKALKIIINHYSKESHYEFDSQAINRVTIIKLSIEEITGKKSGY